MHGSKCYVAKFQTKPRKSGKVWSAGVRLLGEAGGGGLAEWEGGDLNPPGRHTQKQKFNNLVFFQMKYELNELHRITHDYSLTQEQKTFYSNACNG